MRLSQRDIKHQQYEAEKEKRRAPLEADREQHAAEKKC